MEVEPDPTVRAREAERVTFRTVEDGKEVAEEEIGMPEVKFPSLELPPAEHPATIGDYAACLQVWKKASHWYGLAKEHFVMDGFVTDHINIVQDLSRSYKILAYFEKDDARKCKMHKRRVDLLAPVEEVISADVYDMQAKQLAWELAEIHDLMYAVSYTHLTLPTICSV